MFLPTDLGSVGKNIPGAQGTPKGGCEGVVGGFEKDRGATVKPLGAEVRQLTRK